MNAGDDRVELGLRGLAVEPGLGVEERRDGALGVGLGLRVAALERPDRGRDHRAVVLERSPGHAQDELGIGGRAEVVDPELLHVGALGLQGDALDVPERRGAGDAAGQQGLDRLEADRRRPYPVGIAAVARDDRAQHRDVRRQAGHAGAPAFQVARARDLRLREDGGQRTLDQRHHAHDVGALLARQAEVVDVEDRHVGAPALEQAQRVGGCARRPHLELHALRVVVPAGGREVDARVHAVGREVEQQRGLAVRAVGAGAATTRKDGAQQHDRSQRYRHVRGCVVLTGIVPAA